MGRFYKTASDNPLDYMYKENTPLMEKVVGLNDKYIDQNMSQLGGLEDLANYSHLVNDDEDAKAITAGYRNKVDEISKAIQDDPANWRKNITPIRDLTRDLKTNYETGAISKQIGNYNARKNTFDNVDKQVQLYHTSGGTKGVSPERAAAYKQHWDDSFQKTGFDSTTGNFNIYKGGSVMDNIDIKKKLADGLDKVKADKSNQYQTDEYGQGWYLNKVTQKMERITPEKILSIAYDNISPEMINYLREDSKVGLLKNQFDAQGNLVKPFSYSEVPMSPDEQAEIATHQRKIDATKDKTIRAKLQATLDSHVAQLKNRRSLDWNNDSVLAPALRGLSNEYSYNNVEGGNTMTNAARGAAYYNQGQQNYRQTRSLDQALIIHKDNLKAADDHFQARLTWDKDKEDWNRDHPKGKATGTSSSSSSSTKAGAASNDASQVQRPPETTTSNLSTQSFADWLVKDKNGKDVQMFSKEGLSGTVDNKKKEIDDVDKTLGLVNSQLVALKTNHKEDTPAYSDLAREKENLELRKTTAQSDLNQARTWYQQSTEAALNNHPASNKTFKPDEIALYKKYAKDPTASGLTSQIHQLEQTLENRDKNAPANNPTPESIKFYTEDERIKKQITDLRTEQDNFFKVKSKVDEARDNVLKGIANDNITSRSIKLSDKDSQDAAEILLGNTQGSEVFDKFGNKTGVGVRRGNNWLNWDGNPLNFSDNKLQEYIKKNNVKVHIDEIGTSTKLGKGNAVVKVTFDDPSSKGLSSEPYYISVNSDVQKELANKYKGSSNKDIAAIANRLDDDEANDISRQFMQPVSELSLGKEGKSNPYTVMLPFDGNRVPVTVTPFTEGGSVHYHVTYTGKNKKGEPEEKDFNRVRDDKGNPVGGPDGLFKSIDDFIDNFKGLKPQTSK